MHNTTLMMMTDMFMMFMIHDTLIIWLRTLWLIFMLCLWNIIKDVMINIYVILMILWWCYMLSMSVMLTLSIRVVPIWVFIGSPPFHRFMTLYVDHQSDMLCWWVVWWIITTRYHRCSFESLINESVPTGSLDRLHVFHQVHDNYNLIS